MRIEDQLALGVTLDAEQATLVTGPTNEAQSQGAKKPVPKDKTFLEFSTRAKHVKDLSR